MTFKIAITFEIAAQAAPATVDLEGVHRHRSHRSRSLVGSTITSTTITEAKRYPRPPIPQGFLCAPTTSVPRLCARP